MSSLKKHEMEAFLADENKKRNRELCDGYRHALDPKPFVEKLKEDRAALAQELEEREQNAEVDQLESEPADDDQDDDSRTGKKPKATTSKKRKRESDLEPKQKKAPKAKKDSVEPNKKKSAAGKGRKNGVKSKAMVESEDEGDNAEEDADDDGGVGTSKRASPPPSKRAKREKDDGDDCDFFFLSLSFKCSQRSSPFPVKNSTDPQADQVRDWRHRLQKVFLSNKALPKSEVRSSLYRNRCIVWHLMGDFQLMPEIDGLFTTVEEYESMTIEQLQVLYCCFFFTLHSTIVG